MFRIMQHGVFLLDCINVYQINFKKLCLLTSLQTIPKKYGSFIDHASLHCINIPRTMPMEL